MEILFTVFNFLLLILLVISPFFIIKVMKNFNLRYKFIIYLLVGSIISALQILFLSWWNYASELMLLRYYGYNFDGMNEIEYYKDVLPTNKENVKSIVLGVNGIGWTLKGILSYIFYLPYLLIAYALSSFLKKNRMIHS